MSGLRNWDFSLGMNFHVEYSLYYIIRMCRDFPGDPVVKNLPASVRDTGILDPNPGKISQAEEHLSLYITTTGPVP